MNYKIPSSILISLYLALAAALVRLAWNALGGAQMENGVLDFLIFFFLIFLILVGVLEWMVYRRLKNITLLSQREIQKLKDIETYRREFLGEVSHELKTPIFAVQGFIDTLLEGAMEDDRVRDKFLKKAGKNADRLASLVQDLLIITQAESGQIKMDKEPFSLFELINEVVDSIDYKFTKKKRDINCVIEANGHEEVQVSADRERIQQVLTNLVDNAIKYGDSQGTVHITLSIEEDQLRISIKDNGPGIEEEHLDKIFRRFYRIDKSRSREKGGTGLGLAICKHFLEAHESQIHVQSTVGEGTTFTFELPIVPEPTPVS